MGALLAEFQISDGHTDERRAPRRHLRLLTDGRRARGDLLATISNLSSTGMLIDTPIELSVGEPIEVDLPEAGSVTAYVIWTSGTLSGCQFRTILSQATVSAAQLLSPAAPWPPPIAAPAIKDDLDTRIRRARRQFSVIATAALLVSAVAVAMLLLGLIRMP